MCGHTWKTKDNIRYSSSGAAQHCFVHGAYGSDSAYGGNGVYGGDSVYGGDGIHGGDGVCLLFETGTPSDLGPTK